MEALHKKIFVFFLGVFLSGCAIQGISGKEQTTTFGYRFDSILESPHSEPRAPLEVPFRLGVAQAGAASPSNILIEGLQSKLFKSIQPLPCMQESQLLFQPIPPRDIKEILGLAKATDCDALLLIGGSITSGIYKTSLSVFDLTLLGFFLIPSTAVKAQANISAILINCGDNRILFVKGMDREASAFIPTVNIYGAKDRVMKNVLENASRDMAREVIEELA